MSNLKMGGGFQLQKRKNRFSKSRVLLGLSLVFFILAGKFGLIPNLDKLYLESVEEMQVYQPPENLQLWSKTFAKNPELFRLHRNLIKIESITDNEKPVSDYLRQYLEDQALGFQFESDPTGKNIYAYGGQDRNSSLLLTTHIDTVPPFIEYSIEEGDGGVRIHGRGSCDAKGSAAAQVIATQELIRAGLVTSDEISLLFVFAEEVGGDGMKAANVFFNEKNVNWDAVIFGEPTENKLAVGHKGAYLAQIEVFGLASHSGYPEIGVDANKILIEIMHDLENYDWPSSELLNASTINIGLIEAGTAGNVISPYAKCKILIRAAVDIEEITPVVKGILAKHRSEAVDLKLETVLEEGPSLLDHEVADFETYVASYGTDIPKLDQRGFKRYLYGPGSILVAHGDNEYVSAESMLEAVEGYKKLILNALGRS